jgi:hypothetical protein
LYLFATKKELPLLLQLDQPIEWSARILRNKLNHELGPGYVNRIIKLAPFFEPKLLGFLKCHDQVLQYLSANYAHIE